MLLELEKLGSRILYELYIANRLLRSVIAALRTG